MQAPLFTLLVLALAFGWVHGTTRYVVAGALIGGGLLSNGYLRSLVANLSFPFRLRIREIVAATYKSPNATNDVLPHVRSLLTSNGRLEFVVSNDVLGGDPEEHAYKHLHVTYRTRFRTITRVFGEGKEVKLP